MTNQTLNLEKRLVHKIIKHILSTEKIHKYTNHQQTEKEITLLNQIGKNTRRDKKLHTEIK